MVSSLFNRKYIVISVAIVAVIVVSTAGTYQLVNSSQKPDCGSRRSNGTVKDDGDSSVSHRGDSSDTCADQQAQPPSYTPTLQTDSIDEEVVISASNDVGTGSESQSGPVSQGQDGDGSQLDVSPSDGLSPDDYDDDGSEPDESFHPLYPPATLHLYTRDGQPYENNEPRLDQIRSDRGFAVIVHTIRFYRGSSLFRAMMNPDVDPGRVDADRCTVHNVQLQHGNTLAVIDTPSIQLKVSTDDLESNRDLLAKTHLPLKRIYVVLDATGRYEELPELILALSTFYGPQIASKLVFIVNHCNRNLDRQPLHVLPHNVKVCFQEVFPNKTFRDDQIVYVGWEQIEFGSARGWGQLFDDLSAAGQETDDLAPIPNFESMKVLLERFIQNVRRQKELKEEVLHIVESFFSRCAFYVGRSYNDPVEVTKAAVVRLLNSPGRSERFVDVQALLVDHVRRGRETSQALFALCLRPLDATTRSSEAMTPLFENLDAIAKDPNPGCNPDNCQTVQDESPETLINELQELGRLARKQFRRHYQSLWLSACMFQDLHLDRVRQLRDSEMQARFED